MTKTIYYYQETFVEKFFRYLVKVLQYCVMLVALAGLLIVYQGDKEMKALAAELGVDNTTNVYDVYGLEIQSIPEEEQIEEQLKAEIPQLIDKEDTTEQLSKENEDAEIKEAKLSEEKTQLEVVEEIELPVIVDNELSKKVEGMTPKVRLLNTSSYCACEECCGKTDGITASGAKATAWYTVAAGKDYKMGTIIYIPDLADKPNGGWFVVEDRGGAISNDKLDIYLPTHSEALQYGRKNLECYIYEF